MCNFTLREGSFQALSEVRGCRPVLVTFSYYRDREEVFKKSKLLQTNCSILVTEDMSKKTREARYELQKYLVKLARSRFKKLHPKVRNHGEGPY